MRPCEISYVYFDNADQERILREIVEPLRFLLPEWLRDLTFCKVDTDEKYALKCNVRREYRMAEICVRSAFFGQPKPTLRLNVIHELIHIHHAYVNDFVRVRVQDYVGSQNADLNKAMQSEYTDHLEGFIQDFAYVIRDLLLRAESVESISPAQDIREIAEGLMEAAKAFAAPEAITVHESEFTHDQPPPGRCAGCCKEAETLFQGKSPELWFCHPCFHARYVNPGGTERSFEQVVQDFQNAQGATGDGKPYTGVSKCADCGGGLASCCKAGPAGILCGSCWDSKYQHGNGAEPAKPYTGVSAIGSPNTSWVPETPCEDCGQAIGVNASHPQITRPLCPVHRDLELIVPKKETP